MTPAEALRTVLDTVRLFGSVLSTLPDLSDLDLIDDAELDEALSVLASHAARLERDRRLADALARFHGDTLADEVAAYLAENDDPTDG
jgi:hypothetical protein